MLITVTDPFHKHSETQGAPGTLGHSRWMILEVLCHEDFTFPTQLVPQPLLSSIHCTALGAVTH